MLELEILPLMSLVGDMVGQVMIVRRGMPRWDLASFTISPPFRVSSEITRPLMLGSVMVTPKGSTNSKITTSNAGLIDLMNA